MAADEQCRITVVGERHRADLTVPARAPIASYVTALATACGQESGAAMMPAWSLGPAIGVPYAPERSLGELDVLDGAVLYLRDVAEDEYSDPVVYDVAERVAEVAERRLHRRWDERMRTVTTLAIGLGWLITALSILAVRHQGGRAELAELTVTSGLILPAIAWTAAERGWPVPSRLREAVALSAVPLLAVAAWVLSSVRMFSGLDGAHGHVTPGGLTAAALATGALVGAILAYATAAGPATCSVLLTAAVAAMAGAGLAAAKADGITSATVVAVIAFALLTIAPKFAAWIIAFSGTYARAAGVQAPPRGTADGDDADPVAVAMGAAATVLVVWSGCLAVVLGATLVPMAAARSATPVAAAGCLGLGLLLRAGAARLTTEVIPLLVAGSAGLLTLLLFGPGHLGWPSWVSPASAIAIAVILIVYGFRCLTRSPDLPPAVRPRWLGAFGSMLGGTGVALACAALGTFGQLVALGHHL